MAQKTFKLTIERFKELENDLEYLKTVREREVAEQIKEARSFGDLSENSEYDEAKNEQGRLFSRIAEIENILAHAEIIDGDDIQTESVVPGCKVRLVRVGSGEADEYQIVGSQEADPMKRRISDESPLGMAIIGARVGDEVSYEAPAGTMRFKVDAITK
ncbi:transcription elongation factor GreA [Oscillospiraceae bacterium OttesenSCG-928-G22]|nr:transcription elongation factor GreA [Oscillospiraceae bacterium OttesenSCG-928-G22]